MVLELCGGTPSEIVVAGDAEIARASVIDFPLERSASASPGSTLPLAEDEARARAISASSSPAPDKTREGRGAVLAAGRRRQGRHRRRGRAHRRRRPRAARRRSTRGDAPRKPVLTAAAGAHAQGQARARGARPGRSRHLVVHLQAAGRIVRRRRSRNWRSPIRSRPIFPTCGRASFPASSPPRRSNADRGFPDVALFEVGQIFKGDQPRGSVHRRDRRAARDSPRRDGVGRHWSSAAKARSMPSTPRPMRWRCWPPPARRCRRCRSCPADRPGSIPAAAAPFRSVRRTCSAISANCIRARSKRSTPKARWSAFEVILERIPEPKAKPTRAKPMLELSPFQPVDARFRLHRRSRGEGRRHRARRAERRQAS